MQSDENINIFNNIENSPTPVFFLHGDKIEFANRAFAELAEYEREELPGIWVQQLFAGDELLKTVRKDLLDDKEDSENMLRLLTRNLNFKIVLLSSFVINGEEERYLVFCRDITDSSLRQKKLAQAKLYVDSIFSNLDDGVIVLDAEKKIINLNNGALNYGMQKVNEIVELVTGDIDILSTGWADKYNRRIHFASQAGKEVHISANIRKFIISGLFDVYIINFSDITRDVELEKEIQEKNAILQEQFNRMDKELKFARSIQLNMVPGAFRIVRDLEIHTEYLIANAMGGDYYDIQEDGAGRTLISIFDVSGHGVASSLVVMMLKALLQSLNLAKISSSSDIFYYLQRGFKDKIPGKHFVAAVILLYDHNSRKLDVCTGGNYLPLLVSSADGSVKEIGRRGFPIGFIAKPQFDNEEHQLEPGDKILLYTDGIVEAKNSANRFFTRERIIERTQQMNKQRPDAILVQLLSELQEFTENGLYQADDVTVMAVEFGQPEFTTTEISLPDALWPFGLNEDLVNAAQTVIKAQQEADGSSSFTLFCHQSANMAVCRLSRIGKTVYQDLKNTLSQQLIVHYDEIAGLLQLILQTSKT